MSVVGPDLSALTAPARRGFAQALREIRTLFGGARAVELYGASGALGAALAANLVDRVEGAALGPAESVTTLLYVVPDEETAEARAHDLGFFLPPPPASDDPLAPPGGPRAAGARLVAVRRDAARSPDDAAADGGAVPAVAGIRAARAGGLGGGALPARDAAGAVRRALPGDHRQDDARSRGDDRGAAARPGSRARRWSRTRAPSRCAAR